MQRIKVSKHNGKVVMERTTTTTEEVGDVDRTRTNLLRGLELVEMKRRLLDEEEASLRDALAQLDLLDKPTRP